MSWNVISVDYKEENPPVEARLQDSAINIQLDGGELRTKLRINVDAALDLADKIRTAVGEKNFEELEDEILSKDSKIEELENIIEQYEENNDELEDELLSKDSKIEELQDLIEQYEENNQAYREKLSTSEGLF